MRPICIQLGLGLNIEKLEVLSLYRKIECTCNIGLFYIRNYLALLLRSDVILGLFKQGLSVNKPKSSCTIFEEWVSEQIGPFSGLNRFPFHVWKQQGMRLKQTDVSRHNSYVRYVFCSIVVLVLKFTHSRIFILPKWKSHSVFGSYSRHVSPFKIQLSRWNVVSINICTASSRHITFVYIPNHRFSFAFNIYTAFILT